MTKKRLVEIEKLVSNVTKPCQYLGDKLEHLNNRHTCNSEEVCRYEGRMYGITTCCRCANKHEQAIIDLLDIIKTTAF